MTLHAVRSLNNSDERRSWKLGETRTMFIRFRHDFKVKEYPEHGGYSDLINITLADNPNAPVKEIVEIKPVTEESGSMVLILGIVITLIVIVILGLVGVFFYRKHNNKEDGMKTV